jgi:hypothetical protein
MSFVLDNSITMRWYFADGSPQELTYATRVLRSRNERYPMSSLGNG